MARRSSPQLDRDKLADVILLDSIGELIAAYPLADIVFVGGSLIPHGGQNILEPAAAGKAIVTGPHTHNFAEAVDVFVADNALRQLPVMSVEKTVDSLFATFSELIENPRLRNEYGQNASAVIEANRGAAAKTIGGLKKILFEKHKTDKLKIG